MIVYILNSKFIMMCTCSFTPRLLGSVSLHIPCLGASQETLTGAGSLGGVANDLEVKFSPLRMGAGG